MAKLADNIRNSGLNSGAQILGKMMRVADIEEDPEISNMFLVHEDIFQAILADIQKNGFDVSEPPVLWKGKKTVVDGRTRVRAAKAAGLLEIPVVEREFESLDEAKFYCYKRQADRRNLTQAEIFTVAAELRLKTNYDGSGRSGERLAKDLGVSAGVITKARTVAKHGSKEDIAAVKNNELTINKAYEKLREGKKGQEKGAEDKTEEGMTETISSGGIGVESEGTSIGEGDILDSAFDIEEKVPEDEKEFAVTDSYGLPENVKFLKSAVILLVERQELAPAQLLIDHFLRKKERGGFYKLLPKAIRDQVTGGENAD
jgi:ParB family chromosome partitioning protein